MATYTSTTTQEYSTNGSNGIAVKFLVTELNAEATANIPAYSKINSVTLSCESKNNASSVTNWAKADIKIGFRNSNGDFINTKFEQKETVDNTYDTYSCTATDCFYSGTSNAGHINVSNAYDLCFYVEGTWKRVFYMRNVKVVWDYTITTYTLTVNAGTGGTVSGGGTYNSHTTATLKATPNTGYKFVKWSDGNTSATRTVTVTGNATYTATFEKLKYTVNFKNADGSAVSSKTLEHGSTLGTLPTVSRSGYAFAGWIPCEPAKKSDGTVLDSYKYNGDNAYPLDKKYKYTDKLSVHIEAYMSNWEDIASLKAQIISCTEGGGWGLGYQANSSGHGTELYAGGYKGIDLELGTAGKFSNNTWYSFDIVFSNGTFEAYVNGTKKGTQTTANTAISYNSENTIFVGAEAAKSATTPGGNYFKGHISNVFIANKGTRLAIATTSTVVEGDIDYYPVWRLNAYAVTFKDENGTTLKTETVSYGSKPTPPSNPTKADTAQWDYTFDGWYDAIGNKWTSDTVITSDTVFTARYTAVLQKYTITASGTNGTVTGGGTYEYGKTVTLTATPDDGYQFVKWSDGVETATRTVTVTGAAAYTAVFEKALPEIKNVQMIYLDKQISETNKVPCGEGFIISVELS